MTRPTTESSELLPGAADTIAAIATAPGRGAIAVVRMSGPAAFDIARRVSSSFPGAARHATLVEVSDLERGVVDRALLTLYPGPASYTGEDMVEFSTHGGSLVPTAVLAAVVRGGARPALPGEFTRRAVLNGKMDILQAEAVGDLVDARSRAMLGVALAQLDGGLSRRVGVLRSALLDLDAMLAYDIDFPEEDDGPIAPARIDHASRELLDALDALAATAGAGDVIRDGALAVIIGAPNVGKSSLFNALLGQHRAIVSDIPGTTRDAVEALLDPGTVPIRLVDTAGVRAPGDRLEALGIEVSDRYLREAQLVLACGDSPESRRAAVAYATREGADADAAAAVPVLVVATKRDDAPGGAGAAGDLVTECYQILGTAGGVPPHAVSAESGLGIRELAARMEEALAASSGIGAQDAPMLTRARHRHAIDEARRELAGFRAAWFDERLPAPVAATHLRSAIVALEDLIGVVDVEDVLDRVFSSFCIGK